MITADDLRLLTREARSVAQTLRDELTPVHPGAVAVSGMLAEQLAKELGRDADRGAVVLSGSVPPPDTEVLVRVLAGEPTEEDDTLVRDMDRRDIPTVVVQLWPQADWTRPFVLTPFVVECSAGEGFPMREIADRIVEASTNGARLASRIPVLDEAVSHHLVRHAAIRSAVTGVAAGSDRAARPLIALEQLRMLARLRAATPGRSGSDDTPVVAGAAALVLAAGFGLRALARSARTVLPPPVADAAVAAAGTWALAKALEAVSSRVPKPE